MRSLFFKIFFSFWLTIVLMGVILYFVALQNRPDSSRTGFHHFVRQAMTKYGEEAVRSWRSRGIEGLRAYTQGVEGQTDISLYLFAGQQGPLSGRPAPPEATELVAKILGGDQGIPDVPPRGDKMKWLGSRLGQQERRPGQPYVIVMRLPGHPPPFPVIFHPEGDIILLYFLVGGLVCYFLSSSLTAPIRKLQEATRRIARGDFSVRVGKEFSRKNNEVAGLGRDFDLMAGRVESLLLAQKNLLRDISHELRSPLARLNVALELARQRAGQEACHSLDRIEKESERLNELVGQLITLNVLESGAQELKKERLNLVDLLKTIAVDAEFEGASRQRSVHLKTGDRDEAVIYGSRELLRRALENVVRNSIHYTAEDSAVEISCATAEHEGEQRIIISVRDHGAGLPEAYLQQIFKPFFRADEARDRQSGGSGIGLAIAERAIRLHQGTMTATNAEDGGLIITIVLPLSLSPYRA